MPKSCVWSTSKGLRAAWKQTAMANFSPTHARTPPPKGTQASGFTAAASGVPSMNRSGMNSSGTCNSAKCHSAGPHPRCQYSMQSQCAPDTPLYAARHARACSLSRPLPMLCCSWMDDSSAILQLDGQQCRARL